MSALLEAPKADGFPVAMVCVIVAHRSEPTYIGDLVVIDSPPRHNDKVRLYDSGEPKIETGYYGQEVQWLDGSGWAFIALSWLRPATEQEIQEAGL